jgi:flagellar hook-associated protein 2
MSTSSTLFTGSSRYSQDFQAVIQRAVSIASLPLTQYKAQQDRLNGESAALDALKAKFSGFQTALGTLAGAAAGAQKATSSNTAVLQGTATSDAATGTYTLDVTNAGSAAGSLSSGTGLPKVTDPRTSGLTSSKSLTVTTVTDPGTPEAATKTFTVTTNGTSLNELRDSINALEGADLQATVVNVGTAGSPDYRLSVQSSKLAPQQIQLNDGSKDLMTFQAAGARVSYQLNGGADVFYSDSRSLALAEGLTVDVLAAAPGSPVTVTVAGDTSKINGALSGLAVAYNAAVDELDKARGNSGGVLTGNSIVSGTSRALATLNFYQSDSTSLASIGLVLDKVGHLSVDQDLFNDAMKDPGKVSAFIGSSTDGFVQSANATMDAIIGSSGSLIAVSDGLQADLKQQQRLIDENTARVDDLQTRLQNQMAAADALIAGLEQQASYMTLMIQAMAQNSKNA